MAILDDWSSGSSLNARLKANQKGDQREGRLQTGEEERYFPLRPEIPRPAADWRLRRKSGAPNEMRGLPRPMDRLMWDGAVWQRESLHCCPFSPSQPLPVAPTASAVTHPSSRPRDIQSPLLHWILVSLPCFLTFDSSLLFVSVSLSVPAFLSPIQSFPVSLFLSQLSKVLSPFYSHFSQ